MCKMAMICISWIFRILPHTAYSVEEVVARDFLVNERPRVTINIVDASNLDVNLYLTVPVPGTGHSHLRGPEHDRRGQGTGHRGRR